MEAIKAGRHEAHGNYYSDVEALGLIKRTNPRQAVLTKAGTSFLGTKREHRDDPARAEYELIRVLYFSGIAHPIRVEQTLSSKRQNLLRFLDACITTPGAKAVLRNPKLLAIAEALPQFPGSLQRFLRLPVDQLEALSELGETGFASLWSETASPQGLGRLSKKIAGDYSRAAERRLHFLMAMVLHEIRSDLIRRGHLFDELQVPAPFSNLVTERDILALADKYTDELRVVEEQGRILVFLRPDVLPAPTAPTVSVVGIRTPGHRLRSPRRVTGRLRQTNTQRRMIEVALGKEAEDYAEKMILAPRYGNRLVRVGHTDRENAPLADGDLPGADFYLTGSDSTRGLRFLEIKSSTGKIPSTIAITRMEYLRAKKCYSDGLPYEIYVIVFLQPEDPPRVLHIPNFSEIASGLTVDQLVSFELSLKHSSS
ncbi:MAG: hypothetical protein Q7J69_04215 [Candidatus Omnitrophota bacterium]|nr:hypothetical protein [Candidatus Omnitrophota bacterium]